MNSFFSAIRRWAGWEVPSPAASSGLFHFTVLEVFRESGPRQTDEEFRFFAVEVSDSIQPHLAEVHA